MTFSKLKIQNSWIKTLVFLLILSFYASLATHKITLPVYDDLPRQIKIGEEIVHGNFDILYKNTFSYVEPDQTFYNHHWLSGVIFYLLFGILGWGGLVIFKVLVLILAFSFLFFTALKKADFWLVSLVSVPTIFILSERTALRPEIFSYLFISIFLYILFSFEDNPKSKKIYWLIPLQLLWVNMHVLFSIGVMLVVGFVLEKIIHNYRDLLTNFKETIKNNELLKKLFIVLVAVILVSIINPRGINGVFYRYPAEYPVEITEFKTLLNFERGLTIWSTLQINTFKISAVLLIISFLVFYIRNRYRFKQNKFPIFYILASLCTIYIGFHILRGISLFAFILLLVFSHNINEHFLIFKEKIISKSSKNKFILKLSFILVLMFMVFVPNVRSKIAPFSDFGMGLVEGSNDSVEFFKRNNLKGPIYNDADIGSYLIFHLYPYEKVFADNRFGDAYSVDYGRNVYLASMNNEEAWLEISKKYDFQTIYLYQYGGAGEVRDFIIRRLMDPAWVLVYGDKYAIIFIRNIPENKEIIEQYSITRTNVIDRLRKLIDSEEYIDLITAADLLNLLGQNDFAQNLFLEVVYKWPKKGHIWMIMGEWEVVIDQYRSRILAVMYLERAISLGYTTAEAYYYLGMAYNKLGQNEKAIDALEKALKINPDRRDAKDLLHELDRRTR